LPAKKKNIKRKSSKKILCSNFHSKHKYWHTTHDRSGESASENETENESKSWN